MEGSIFKICFSFHERPITVVKPKKFNTDHMWHSSLATPDLHDVELGKLAMEILKPRDQVIPGKWCKMYIFVYVGIPWLIICYLKVFCFL